MPAAPSNVEAIAAADALLPFALTSPEGTSYLLTSVLAMTAVAAVYLGHDTRAPTRTLVFKHQRSSKAVWAEVSIQRALSASASPYTLPLLDRFSHPSGIFMVLPYCGDGDLFDEILRVHSDPEASPASRDAWATSRFLTLLQGVAHMHGEGIFHRDLKPENILIHQTSALASSRGLPLIADFGIATRDPTAPVRGFGSEYYMAPEALMSEADYASVPPSSVPAAAADVWSLGVIALNLLTGRNPWARAEASADAAYAAFLADPWALMDLHNLSEPAGALLIRMLCPEPRKRATVLESLRFAHSIHQWRASPIVYTSAPETQEIDVEMDTGMDIDMDIEAEAETEDDEEFFDFEEEIFNEEDMVRCVEADRLDSLPASATMPVPMPMPALVIDETDSDFDSPSDTDVFDDHEEDEDTASFSDLESFPEVEEDDFLSAVISPYAATAPYEDADADADDDTPPSEIILHLPVSGPKDPSRRRAGSIAYGATGAYIRTRASRSHTTLEASAPPFKYEEAARPPPVPRTARMRARTTVRHRSPTIHILGL